VDEVKIAVLVRQLESSSLLFIYNMIQFIYFFLPAFDVTIFSIQHDVPSLLILFVLSPRIIFTITIIFF
jgi:hypothetical protein